MKDVNDLDTFCFIFWNFSRLDLYNCFLSCIFDI